MRRLARRFLLAGCLLTLGATAARADLEPVTRRHRVGMELGLASAVGTAGVGYQFAPAGWLRMEGGAGWGPTGMQLSIMPKLALGSRACAFIAGVGPSLAVGGGTQTASAHGTNPGVIPWLNLDLPGIECHARSGFSFQATLGLTMPLADFHYDIADLGDTVHAGEILPQGRVGFGWWF